MLELNECIRYLNEYCNFHFLPAWKGETVKLHTVFERPQNIIYLITEICRLISRTESKWFYAA